MKKVFAVNTDESGSSEYRLMGPVGQLRKQKLADVKFIEEGVALADRKFTPEDIGREGDWCDYWVTQRVDSRAGVALISAMKKRGVRIIIDIDDDVFNVQPDNLAYEKFRHRETHEMFDVTPVDDSNREALIELVKKGKGNFVDIKGTTCHVFEKYEHPRHYSVEGIKAADAVTVSTPELARLYAKYNKNIHIYPNSYDFSYSKPVKHHADERVVVNWFGSHTHYRDLEQVSQAMDQIMTKFPKVEFHIMGLKTDFLVKMQEKWGERVKIRMGVRVGSWHEEFNKLEMDIGLAPLMDNMFNRGKSELKYVEFASRGVPVIATSIAPYKRAITHGENGYLVKGFKDWMKYITKLIREPKLRATMGAKAREHAFLHYNVERNAPKLLDVYETADLRLV